jgi:hypothetical protein
MRAAIVTGLVLALGAVSTAEAQHEGHAGMNMLDPGMDMRDASGTSWQPESTPMSGYHFAKGSWMFMVHGFADLVYDHQGGPRGDDDVFGPSMAMLMARRSAGHGTLGLRAMLSLDPATVGTRGYPLLLQTGETADGKTPLVDRQHPHDLFMELSASYSLPFREHGAVFGYLAYPGEPALGPPAFMHRFSGMTVPESPILHHWTDSTHITFGVGTLGATWNQWKLEGSVFTGREPDEHRWGFDEPRLDSFSGRLSYNPTANWALHVSAGHLTSPEQLEPDVDVDRVTAGVSYNRRLGAGNWQMTAMWGRNRKEGRNQDGGLLEATWWSGHRHTVFARAELVEKDELFEEEPLSHEIFTVGKLSVGYVYDFARVGPIDLGIGALGSLFLIPDGLKPSYGNQPASFMVFARSIVR